MGLLDWLAGLFGPGKGHNIDELARRLDVTPEELRAFQPAYTEFQIPKRDGRRRTISAPDTATKSLQRRILKRLLARLECHPAATGFERGHSIVTNALPHARKAVVIRLDLKDFFPSTHAKRVVKYFRRIGWNREAAALIVRLCTHQNGLPQGAPTSPRLANLVNRRLDMRLAGLATKLGASYTRYADDLTFSLDVDDRDLVHGVVRSVKLIAGDMGYSLHQSRKKLHVRRPHQRQQVTGLIVNDGVRLPRRTRRWLRAVRHRRETTGRCSLSDEQLAGWESLENMVREQGGSTTR